MSNSAVPNQPNTIPEASGPPPDSEIVKQFLDCNRAAMPQLIGYLFQDPNVKSIVLAELEKAKAEESAHPAPPEVPFRGLAPAPTDTPSVYASCENTPATSGGTDPDFNDGWEPWNWSQPDTTAWPEFPTTTDVPAPPNTPTPIPSALIQPPFPTDRDALIQEHEYTPAHTGRTFRTSRGTAPSPPALPLANRFGPLDVPPTLNIGAPRQPNVISQGMSPTIYAPNNNISIAPHILFTPERLPPSRAVPKTPVTPKKRRKTHTRDDDKPYHPRQGSRKKVAKNASPPALIPYVEVPRPPRGPGGGTGKGKAEATTLAFEAMGDGSTQPDDYPNGDDSPMSWEPTGPPKATARKLTKQKALRYPSPSSTLSTPSKIGGSTTILSKKKHDEIGKHVQIVSAELEEVKGALMSWYREANVTDTHHLTELKSLNERMDRISEGVEKAQGEIRAENTGLVHCLHRVVGQGGMLNVELRECRKSLRDAKERMDDMKGWSERVQGIEDRVEKLASRDGNLGRESNNELEQLRFHVSLLADGHTLLMRQFDYYTRFVLRGEDLAVLHSPEGFPAEVVAKSAQHWMGHVIDAAKQLMPGVLSPALTADLLQRLGNCQSTNSALAGILWIAHDLLSAAQATVSASANDTCLKARAALRLYTGIYTSIRQALVSTAMAPGAWRRDATLQIAATEGLFHYVSSLVSKADLSDAQVTYGEPYIGLTDSPKDRWLPLIVYGDHKPEFPHLLLSTPPNTAFDSLDSFMCSHPSIISWQGFFVRKFPSLALDRVPLFCTPVFPCPWSEPPCPTTDSTATAKYEWTSGADAVQALVSWAGRALLASSLRKDETATLHCARHALTTYSEL
jgi:hypothetical protein